MSSLLSFLLYGRCHETTNDFSHDHIIDTPHFLTFFYIYSECPKHRSSGAVNRILRHQERFQRGLVGVVVYVRNFVF